MAEATRRRDPTNELHTNGTTNGFAHPAESDQEEKGTAISHKVSSPPLAAVSLRAFLLGTTVGTSFLCTVYLAIISHSPFWRLPAFLGTLSLFHFLEYYITAAYNPSAAGVSAFLLSQNGSAYNVAHTLAFLECTLHCYFRPHSAFMAPSSYLRKVSSSAEGGVPHSATIPLVIGFTMLVMGQLVRSLAMIRAGSNFNHIVQLTQKQGHVLVKDGIYGVLRHPSYFGFWWWGLGTQVMLGNGICLLGYAVVLWRFFRHRIWGRFTVKTL